MRRPLTPFLPKHYFFEDCLFEGYEMSSNPATSSPVSSTTPATPSQDRPLRLAYLSYRSKPTVGGQGIYTRHLTKALVDLGHSIEVFSGQPYPVLDDRIGLTKLPSLDIFNDQYPGRFPAYWEIKSKADILELATFSTGQFPEPLAFSYRALQTLKTRAPEEAQHNLIL